MEEWRDVVGYESHYQVSNFGRVKRKKGLTYYKDGRVAQFSETILKPSLNHKGYERVYLSVGSKKHTINVHRIVAKAFVSNQSGGDIVNHKDCNKLNNQASNLEWVTNTENIRHAFANGRFKERDKTTILNIKHMRDKLCFNSDHTNMK